jgi:hypothetical protein
MFAMSVLHQPNDLDGRRLVKLLLMILATSLLLSACASRTCHIQRVPMFWVDGSISTITLTTCHPTVKRS